MSTFRLQSPLSAMSCRGPSGSRDAIRPIVKKRQGMFGVRQRSVGRKIPTLSAAFHRAVADLLTSELLMLSRSSCSAPSPTASAFARSVTKSQRRRLLRHHGNRRTAFRLGEHRSFAGRLDPERLSNSTAHSEPRPRLRLNGNNRDLALDLAGAGGGRGFRWRRPDRRTRFPRHRPNVWS